MFHLGRSITRVGISVHLSIISFIYSWHRPRLSIAEVFMTRGRNPNRLREFCTIDGMPWIDFERTVVQGYYCSQDQ